MIYKIKPNNIFKILLIIIIFLVFLNIVTLLLTDLFGYNNIFTKMLNRLFNLDKEMNIPTWYATITLFICSVLLGIISIKKKMDGDKYRLHWAGLSLIFLSLSIDESSALHELFMKRIPHQSGPFYFSWVIIGIPAVLIFIIIFLKFFFDLPEKMKFLFFISAALFVSGALGMELVDGWYASMNKENITVWYISMSKEIIPYALMTTLEETLEMLGVAIFIYSLLIYIQSFVKEITIKFSS